MDRHCCDDLAKETEKYARKIARKAFIDLINKPIGSKYEYKSNFRHYCLQQEARIIKVDAICWRSIFRSEKRVSVVCQYAFKVGTQNFQVIFNKAFERNICPWLPWRKKELSPCDIIF